MTRKPFRSLTSVAALGVALAVLLVGGTLAAPVSAASSPNTAGKVDINTAGEAELMTLPGIGQVLAQRIIAFRDEHGPFRRAEDLMKVKGIGEKSFQKLRVKITVGKAGND